MKNTSMEDLVSLCKRRGFIFQSNEIYGGLQGLYDYGPLGVELKNNLKKSWWKSMIYERDDIEGIDSSILTNPLVLKYSGHENTFTDPLVDCKTCGERFKADQVPDYWREASAILGGVILVGTLIEISSPDYTLDNGGFAPMYFLWAFNSLIYVVTMRGRGVFRPVYEYLSIFGYISIIIFSGANVFFDYAIPESIQPIFGIGWIAMVIGLGYGGYVAWGDKMSSGAE